MTKNRVICETFFSSYIFDDKEFDGNFFYQFPDRGMISLFSATQKLSGLSGFCISFTSRSVTLPRFLNHARVNVVFSFTLFF